MNIQAMLLRLQNALGQTNLSNQMLLHPGSDPSKSSESFTEQQNQVANFVVGYNGSPNSQTALDFVFWMADQARLSLHQQVTVHVVYVLDSCSAMNFSCVAAGSLNELRSQLSTLPMQKLADETQHRSQTAVLSRTEAKQLTESGGAHSHSSLSNSLEYADRILWQARCLADEWRGSLEAHLRFGSVTVELHQVVEAVEADLLFVGCSSPHHALVQQLSSDLTCPILGIPTELEAEAT